MRKFAFISRHAPTWRQHGLAAKQEIELVHIGDLDPFTVDITDIKALEQQYGYHFDGIVTAHPAVALRLALEYPIGIFEDVNVNMVEGPQLVAKALHVYNIWSQQRGWL